MENRFIPMFIVALFLVNFPLMAAQDDAAINGQLEDLFLGRLSSEEEEVLAGAESLLNKQLVELCGSDLSIKNPEKIIALIDARADIAACGAVALYTAICHAASENEYPDFYSNNPVVVKTLLDAGVPVPRAKIRTDIFSGAVTVPAVLLTRGATLDFQAPVRGRLMEMLEKSSFVAFCKEPELEIQKRLTYDDELKNYVLNELLYYSALAGSYEHCSLLLKAGAQLEGDLAVLEDNSPLIEAVRGFNGGPLLDLLLAKRSSFWMRGVAYQCAQEQKSYAIQGRLMKLAVLCVNAIRAIVPSKQALRKGLFVAIRKRDVKKAVDLISAGANIEGLDEYDATGATPLLRAVDTNYVPMVSALIKANADVNNQVVYRRRNGEIWTPLQAADRNGRRCIEPLVAAGAEHPFRREVSAYESEIRQLFASPGEMLRQVNSIVDEKLRKIKLDQLLDLAIRADSPEMVTYLFNAGAQVETLDANHCELPMSLYVAINTKNMAIILSILARSCHDKRCIRLAYDHARDEARKMGSDTCLSAKKLNWAIQGKLINLQALCLRVIEEFKYPGEETHIEVKNTMPVINSSAQFEQQMPQESSSAIIAAQDAEYEAAVAVDMAKENAALEAVAMAAANQEKGQRRQAQMDADRLAGKAPADYESEED